LCGLEMMFVMSIVNGRAPYIQRNALLEHSYVGYDANVFVDARHVEVVIEISGNRQMAPDASLGKAAQLLQVCSLFADILS
jgi:hypothetical protein